MSNIKYRPEVDGLRAVAVMPVLFYHAGFLGFAGGYLGVDVFFVISGYLITSIILRDLFGQGFSFKRFYERRARRIIPALTLVLVACVPVAFLVMTPADLSQFGTSLVATVTFLSNVFFYLKTDYFGRAAEYLPLIHTWSLSIEEQYYLFFPVLLIFLGKYMRKSILWILIAIFLISLVGAQVYTASKPTATFFLLPFRAWELVAGAIVAYLEVTKGPAGKSKWSTLATTAGLICILAPMSLFDNLTYHPGLLTLIPVVGTVLILAYGRDGGPITAMLSSKPFIFIGLISYSLYLWHQPIFVFYRLYSLSEPTVPVYLVLIALSIIVSALAWKFVETPFRNSKVVPARSVWALTAAGTAVLVGVGFAFNTTKGMPGRLPNDLQKLLATAAAQGGTRMSQNKKPCHARPVGSACKLGSEVASPTWALLGDSHAASLGRLFDEALEQEGASGMQYTFTTCAYGEGILKYGAGSNVTQCSDYSKKVADALKAQGIRNVVVNARWPFYVSNERFDNHEGGIEPGNRNLRFVPKDGPTDGPEREQRMLDLYVAAIQGLLDDGLRVILVYPIPEAGWHIPTEVHKRRLHGLDEPVTMSFAVWDERTKAVRDAFNAIPDQNNLIRVKPEDVLCDKTPSGRCSAVNGDGLLYYDTNHLTQIGVRLVLEDTLRKQIKISQLEAAQR